MDKMFKHNIPHKTTVSTFVDNRSILHVRTQTKWKNPHHLFRVAATAEVLDVFFQQGALGPIVVSGLSPSSSSLRFPAQWKLFHIPQASVFPYHEPSTSRGRCSTLLTPVTLPEQNYLFEQPLWVVIIQPCVYRRIWDFLSLLPANRGENTFEVNLHFKIATMPRKKYRLKTKQKCWKICSYKQGLH